MGRSFWVGFLRNGGEGPGCDRFELGLFWGTANLPPTPYPLVFSLEGEFEV